MPLFFHIYFNDLDFECVPAGTISVILKKSRSVFVLKLKPSWEHLCSNSLYQSLAEDALKIDKKLPTKYEDRDKLINCPD